MICRICKEPKTSADFYRTSFRRKNGSRGFRRECKACGNKRHAEYVEKNKAEINGRRRGNYHASDKIQAISQNLKRYYGLTIEDYNRMFLEQQGCCKICGVHQSGFERRLDVDHDHQTKKIRGLLCIRCNRGIGLLQDSIEVVQRALDYLIKNKK